MADIPGLRRAGREAGGRGRDLRATGQTAKAAKKACRLSPGGVPMNKTRCGQCRHVSDHDTGIWWFLRS